MNEKLVVLDEETFLKLFVALRWCIETIQEARAIMLEYLDDRGVPVPDEIRAQVTKH